MPARKTKPHQDESNYTQPALRERIKKRVLAGSKGGRAGQWSARKAQLVAQEYEKAGGGYRGKPTEKQQHLQKWTEEKWTTSDRKRARRAEGTTRYLPEAAWRELPEDEKRATNREKVAASRKGRQFVSNTPRAKAAGARARSGRRTTR